VRRTRPVVLLTDFGPQSAYVGQLKLVLHRLAPQAPVLDLAHDLPPQNRAAAALTLEGARRFLPRNAVVVVVVDPGVGSSRRIVAARYADDVAVLAPDNGILRAACGFEEPAELRAVANAALFLKPVSTVFHGRDILAPVAAKLARGMAWAELGPALSWRHLVPAPWSDAAFYGDSADAEVILADRFGNLLTNLRAEWLRGHRVLQVRCRRRRFPFVTHYEAVAPGDPLALIGSHGRLELAVRDGSAAERFAISAGHPVRVDFGIR